MARSVGIVECDCLSDVVSAADRMAKAADISLVRQIQIGNSRLALVIEGDTDEVQRALGSAKIESNPRLTTELVVNVEPRVLKLFDLPGGGLLTRT
jgi:microcompartment protein CcmL/EutN